MHAIMSFFANWLAMQLPLHSTYHFVCVGRAGLGTLTCKCNYFLLSQGQPLGTGQTSDSDSEDERGPFATVPCVDSEFIASLYLFKRTTSPMANGSQVSKTDDKNGMHHRTCCTTEQATCCA